MHEKLHHEIDVDRDPLSLELCRSLSPTGTGATYVFVRLEVKL